MTQEEFEKLVLERFGILADVQAAIKRLERNVARIRRHPELPDDDELEDLAELEDLDDELDEEEEED